MKDPGWTPGWSPSEVPSDFVCPVVYAEMQDVALGPKSVKTSIWMQKKGTPLRVTVINPYGELRQGVFATWVHIFASVADQIESMLKDGDRKPAFVDASVFLSSKKKMMPSDSRGFIRGL